MAIYRKTDTDRQGQKQHASTWSISKPLRDAILSYARNRKTPADKPIFRLTKRTAEAVAVHAELAKIRRTDGALDFHALRHTFTTTIANDAPAHVAQRAARHKSIQTTQRYMHATNDQVDAAIAYVRQAVRPSLSAAQSVALQSKPRGRKGRTSTE